MTLPAPADAHVCQLILDAIKFLGDGSEHFDVPVVSDVHAQWTGSRAGVPETEPESKASEAEKFFNFEKEVSSPTTILYVHGGGN